MIITMTVDDISSNRGGIGHVNQMFALFTDHSAESATWRCEQGGPVDDEMWLRHGIVADDETVYETFGVEP